MAITNFSKGMLTLAGAVTLLGLGYAGKSWIIGDRIVDLLKQHNPEKQLLTRNSPIYGKRWKEAWLKYRKENANSNKWNLGDWKAGTAIKESDYAPTSFIDACDRNSQERVSSTSNELYQEVLNWCTSESKVSIKDLIRESGKRTLTRELDSKTKEDSGWKPLLKSYLTANKGKEKDALGVAGWKPNPEPVNSLESNKDFLEDFIKKCTELSSKEVNNKEDPNYQKALSHCSDDIHAEDLVKESGRKILNLTELKKNVGGKANDLAQEIWQSYISKNKDKVNGADEWKIPNWEQNKLNEVAVPQGFWDNCNEKRKVKTDKLEDESAQQVMRYCSVPKDSRQDYIETDN